MSESAAQRAEAQREAGELDMAEATCLAALPSEGDDPALHRILGTILQRLSRDHEAVASFERAVELDRNDPVAFNQLAVALAESGRLEQALAADRRALELEPDRIPALHLLSQLKTFSPGDPDLLHLEALAGSTEERHIANQISLFFALAKAYDDVGDTRRAFENLTRANDLKRTIIEFDLDAEIAVMRRSEGVYDPSFFEMMLESGSESELPVLIVGMPRSGTTLVEQILASHPAVHGGGELEALDEMASAAFLLGNGGFRAPEGVTGLRRSDLKQLGDTYAGRLSRAARLSRAESPILRVTDKQPVNFRHLGFAQLIVPRARIIHCRRDPVDTCLSCYRAHFKSIPFASDLRELGRFYRAYERMMDHWRDVLPGGWMLEVQYEDLVGNVERVARDLVAHVGLEWDSACLNFHTSARSVRTASFVQVRRPVYSTSVAGSRRYEEHLTPLLDALETDDDPR